MSVSPAAPTVSNGADFKSVTFDLDGRTQLFGWLHPAQPEKARRCGVVLCNPLAYDALSIHRSYRVFASALAAEGYPTLRFDYHGTGDSAGGDGDPDRVAAWVASLHAAIDTCKSLAAVDEVALFGLQFGGTLAVRTLADRSDVTALMLWAPVTSGRKLVRQLRMLHGTSAAGAAANAEAPVEAFDGLEAAGFRHSAQTLADISSIDLLAMPAPTVPAVLIGRDDVAADAEPAQSWLAAGVPLLQLALPGYAAMMRDPAYSIVPDAVIDSLVAWMMQTRPAAAGRIPPPLAPNRAIVTPAPNTAVLLNERPLSFGTHSKLWGIIARPEGPSNALADVAAILVNAGGNHRIGPSRLTVPVARYIAALGCTTLRMDLAGLGDSVKALEKLPIFDINSVADVTQAIDCLQSTDLASVPLRRFVLVGLCSGGFVVMHSAVRDLRVNSQVIMNLPAFSDSRSTNSERVAKLYIKPFRFYLQAMLKPQTWWRALSGGIDLRRIVFGAAARLTQRVAVQQQALLSTLRLQQDASIAAKFRDLCRRGVQTLLILSANDGAVDEMETHLGSNATRMRGEANFRLEIMQGADHTFTSDSARNNLLDSLRRHFERLPTQTEMERGKAS